MTVMILLKSWKRMQKRVRIDYHPNDGRFCAKGSMMAEAYKSPSVREARRGFDERGQGATFGFPIIE